MSESLYWKWNPRLTRSWFQELWCRGQKETQSLETFEGTHATDLRLSTMTPYLYYHSENMSWTISRANTVNDNDMFVCLFVFLTKITWFSVNPVNIIKIYRRITNKRDCTCYICFNNISIVSEDLEHRWADFMWWTIMYIFSPSAKLRHQT